MNGRDIFIAAAIGAVLLLFMLIDQFLPELRAIDVPIPVAVALIATAGAVFGHLISVLRHWLARTYSAKIETSIECTFFPPQDGKRPIELRFAVTNNGGARSRVSQLGFWLRGIESGKRLALLKSNRLEFTKEHVNGEFVTARDEWLFVDAGTTQAFTFPTLIPASLSLILVRMKVAPRRGDRYTEERIFQVPPPEVTPEAA